MATFLARVSHSSRKLHHGYGLTHFLVDKGERYASSAAFGFIKGYYREKSLLWGLPVDLLAGAGLTAIGAGLTIWSQGRSGLAPHLNAIGDSGMTSWLNSLGTAWGAKASGRSIYVVNAGASRPAIAPPGMTQVGALPQAVGGAYLSAEEIAHFASQR